MPELPDVTIYVEAIARRTIGQPLAGLRVASPFVLRTVEPPVSAAEGKSVVAVRRLGKRIAIELDEKLFLVVHLMIAGRFRWLAPVAKLPGKLALAAFDFPTGSLVLTEAGSQRRASLHLLRGEEALLATDRGGLEILDATLGQFAGRVVAENHTIKRALTDPRLFSGVGNAYSDEILHRARLSPVKLTRRLTADEVERLHDAAQATLREWTDRLRSLAGDRFPDKVTAFRDGMAVHGRYGKPCPVCGAPVQRIRYASNETNYCARCQTDGRRLADRALSRLLKDDWPRSIDEVL